MALTTVSTFDKLLARRTEQVFDSHKVITIPGIQNFSREDLSTLCAKIRHSEKSTDLNADALSSALESALKKSRAPAPSTRIRSPTLPLDENADDKTDQWTGNKKSTSTNDTAGNEHRVNGARKATTPRTQKEKSKARSVLKPVPSRISKQPSNKRSLRRRIPRKQHEAKCLGEKAGDSQNTRQEEPQDSNLSPTTTLPAHQVDQPGNLNSQPNPPDQQVEPRRASLTLHPESAQRATRRRTRAPKSKPSTKINVESLTSSMVHKRRWHNPAQEARNPKQENRQRSPREFKTKSGRVSKRPERLGFT